MLTIGELAKRAGLRTSALRYYEREGLLEPAERTEAGYRLPPPALDEHGTEIRRWLAEGREEHSA